MHGEDIELDFWKDRLLYFRDVLAARPGAAALMRNAQSRVAERLRGFYELAAPIFTNTVQLVRWHTGMHMPAHSDRANPDGSPHRMPYRDFASIVYLNEDYEGGELYFPRLDLTVKPATGMLLAFTGGWHHEHGVLKVLSGDRLTMPCACSSSPSRRSPTGSPSYTTSVHWTWDDLSCLVCRLYAAKVVGRRPPQGR